MSMFKNTSKRRVLSWILTLTMLFSQFFGTGSTLVAHAADPEAHNVTTHSGMSYTGDGAVITFKCEGAGKSTPEIEEDDFACVANGETLTIVKPTRTQYKGTGDVTATLTKSNTGSTVFTNTADAIVYYSATEEQFAAYLNDTSKPITSLGTTAPENVGSYVAAITVGGATAYVPYSIEKATPVYSVTNASKDYNAVAVEPIVKATFGNSDEIEISEGVEYLYKKSAEDDSKYSPTAPAQAGAYIVKATVTGTDNYNGETFTADFTIAKANLTDQMVEISNWVAGETPSTPTVSAKFDDESVNFTEAGGTVSYAYKLKSEADTAYKAAQPTAKGAYTVKATVTGMKNFNDVVATTDFDITALTQTAPSEPKMDSNTFDSITLIPIANGEYSIDGENWQDSVLFEGLTADTEYTFYQRYKADDTHDASEATSAKFKTKAHVHQWTFTAKDDVITATCQDGDAHHGDEKDATFTIVSPGASINYNGSEHPATIEFKNPSNALVPTDLSDKTTVEGITIPKIVYTKDDVVMEGVPTDAGIYTASITIGTVTASVEYEIKKATALDDVDAKYKPKAKSDLIYDGSAQALVDLTDIVALDGYTIMYAVGKTAPADEKGYSAVIPTRILATTDLEPYTVWYMFKGNGNHEDITNGAYHFNVKIGKKEITVTPNPITSTYGDEITDAGVKYEGFVEGQDESLLSGELVYKYFRGETEKTGTLDADEYDIKINTSTLVSSNYVVKYATGTLTVNPLNVALEWKTEYEYTGSPIKPEVTITNLLEADKDKVEVTIEKDTATDCGTGYSARATGLTGDKADNYSLVMNNPTRQTTFTIVPKKVTISADNASKTYGGDDPAQLRATILDSDNKEISDSATGYIDATNYTVERAEGEDAGTYVITVKMKDVYVENSNYDITLSTGTFTINKKPVTLSVDSNQGKIYNNDATTDKLKATVTGLVDTDKLNYNLSREDGEDADSYAIKVSLGNNPNYDVEVVNGQNFVISKAEITGVTGIKAEAKTYDGKATATLTYDDVVITGKVPGTDLGVEATGTFADNGNVEFDGQNVIPQTVNISDIKLTGTSAKNYELKVSDIPATSAVISQLPITIAAKDRNVEEETTLASVVTTAVPKAIEKAVEVKSGELLEDQNITSVTLTTYEVADEGVGPEINTAVMDIGDEAVIVPSDVVINNDSDITKNYKITYTNGTATIIGARVHVTAAPSPKATIYTGADQALVTAGTKDNENAKMLYKVDGEDKAYTDKIPERMNAGTYKVWYMADGTDTLAPSEEDFVEVTIAKKPLQVRAQDKTIYYGDEPSDDGVSYSGWVGSDTADVLIGTLVLDNSYVQNGDVGTYTITPSGLTSDNYDIKFVDGELTVEPKELTLNWSEESSLTYNGEAQAPAVVVDGVVGTDELSIKVTLTAKGSTTPIEEAVAVGKYVATAVIDPENANYVLPAAKTKEFEIVKADAEIEAPEAVEGLVYNKEEQALVTEGVADKDQGVWKYALIENNTSEPGNDDWKETVPKASNAKTYYVWYKFEPKTDNYNAVEQTLVEVTIAPKPVIITAKDVEKDYNGVAVVSLELGKDDAEITDAEGKAWTVEDDAITYTVELKDNEDVKDAGTYPIVVTVTNVPANYSVTTVEGTFTIKPLTGVVVKIKGNTNETPYTYDGEVRTVKGYTATTTQDLYKTTGEDSYIEFSGTDTVSNKNAGTYPMGLKAADFTNTNANFADVKFEVTDGKLVIGKKSVYVSDGITAADKPYDGKTDATLNCDNAVIEGKVAGDVLKINATGTFTDANVNGEEGNVTVDITYESLDGASALNYELDKTNEGRQKTTSAKIKKLPVNIRVKDQTVVKGNNFTQAVDDVIVTGTFVSNQKITSIGLESDDFDKTKTGTYDLKLKVESVVITDATITNNYKITSQAGTVTVVDPTATVKDAPVSINDLTYTGKTQKLVTEGTANESGAQIVYSKSENGQYSPSIPTEMNAGDYVVYYKAAGTGYNESEAVSINVTIAKAPLTITASNRTIIYGVDPEELDPEVTYETFVNGESETQEGVLTGTLTCKYDYVKGGAVGNEYTITPEGLDAANYAIKFVEGTLTVEPKTAELAWDETPLVYTGEEQIPAATVTNLEEGDECEVTVTTPKTDAGTYTAVASELSNENYKLPANNTYSFTIASAEGSIETDPVAAELSYTGEPQELVIAGVANVGDIQYALGATATDEPAATEWSTAIPKATFVGDYYVWYRLPYTANYTGTQAKCVTVTIAKAALVISANAMSVAYGEPKPSVEDCSVSYIGLGANDTADKVFADIEDYYAFEIDCDEYPEAGEYDIILTLTKEIELANYVVEAANGTLTVEAQEAALIWDAEEVYPYDGKAHAPSVTIDPESLVYDTDEVAAIVKISTADGKEVTGIPKDAGEYVATVTGLDNSNYKLPEDEEVLTRAFVIKGHEGIITKAPVAKEGLVYNANEQALVEAGEVNGGTLEYALSTSYDKEPEEGWSDEVPTGKDAKSYFVWYRLNGGVNYSDVAAAPLNTDPEKAVIIDQAPLTLKAKDKHVEYGAEEVVFDDSDYTYTGLKGTDKFANTGFEVSLTTDYVQFGTKDTYNIDLTWTGVSKNYRIAGKELGFVHVDPKSVGIIWGDTEFIYDGKAHVPTATPSRNDIMASTDKVEFVVEVEGGEAKNAGTYWAEVTGLTEESNANYRPKADKKRIQFTIAKATISADKITEPVAKTGLVYSASAQQLISAGTVSDNLGTYKYALAASENTAEESLTYTDSIPTGTNAGTYYVWYKVSANNAANYNEIAAKKVSVSIDKASISVSYNANEGEGTKASEVFKIGTASDNITVSTNSFTKAGHEFVSWNTAADGSGTGYAEGDTFAPEKIEDITLYAQWKAVTHTVSFNMNGYGDPIDPVVVISGNTVDEPATPSANGVVFDGWYADAECTEEYDFAAPVVEDITLFAKWLQKYTVSFNMNGYGDPIDPVEVVSGDKVARPATPSANGVVFGGWFTESELTNEYDFAAPVSANITLFAKWTEKFTVSFNMSGHGKQIDSQEVVSGDKAVRPTDPTDPEYTFEDWFTAADYASVYDFNTAVSENITVYAKWNLTISLNSISINKAPDKTVYTEGEVFDTTGMEVVATYTDGSKKTVSGYTITPSANLTASDNKVTVSYTEDSITCTADVAIRVKAKDAADVVVEDEEYSAWNLYEDTTEHTYTVAGASSNKAVKNSNTKSATYYDAVLSGNTITVTVKGDLKKAAKAANSVLEFATDNGVVEFTLPVEYKKPQLKLSVAKVNVKNGVDTEVKTTILRKSAAGVFEPMDLTNATVTFEGKDIEILENGEIGITVNGGVKGKINVAGEGWNSADPVKLNFNVKGSAKDVITVEMGDIKTVIVNSNAKGQTFEFPVFLSGVEASSETVTITDKKNSGLAKIEGGNLVIAYPEKAIKKGTYTITLKGGDANAVNVKVKVSDKLLSDAVKLTVKSKYDVVTGQKMVIVPKFTDLGGKLEDVNIDMDGFSAVVNEAGNIVVDYEGNAYTVKNLNIGTMTFKLSVEGVDDEIAIAVNKVKAKKSAVKVKAAKVTMKQGAEGVANLVCSYTDSAKNLHLVAPLSVTVVKANKVTAVVSEEDPTVINISGLSGKSGSVKVKATFPGGLEKTVTIKVKESK